MRRAAVAALVVLAGCGGGPAKKDDEPKHTETVTKRERAEQKRIHDRLSKSTLPKDMQRELEEAKRELDAADR